MSARVARWLNMGGHGLHSNDPLARTPLPALAVALDEPAATEAEAPVVITDAALEALAGIKAQVAAEQAPPPPVPVPVAADLAALPLFRDTVRASLVRREAARGNRATAGTWQDRYARIWDSWYAHVTTTPDDPPLDYGLGSWDGVVDEIMAQSAAAAEARWLAMRPAPDAPDCPEHEGPAAGRREAWTGSEVPA